MKTSQMDLWTSEFGAEYTERNTFSVGELDDIYRAQYGYTRSEMNQKFLSDKKIDNLLEVGCNVGNQLRNLQSLKYENLYGIELQSYAVERAKQLSKGINIIQGHAFDLPFKNQYFDLVYTSGVLIHIAPEDISKALNEIYRVSKRYIWGLEYYSEAYEEKDYRGNQQAMWKTNFCELYLKQFPDLILVKEEKYKYLQNDQIDQMFLLEKPVKG
ncbi:pseudaminic acid biosynthesis-associated methylase [Paenibacillus andongensis]|uniref:pseudaminic acid biosynthesis-associated methylase n=1 Tax=Paenibacillus andongensis TaxID=2975482 RepID=UPI0021BACE94|nr:pseudaminic acid biosynthesis-associated methylase [Paenibacillus andongensis]